MSSKRRVVFIGLDGVPLEMIQEFTASGVMPNTALILSQGHIKKLRSSIPEISSVAWPSLITGQNPGAHGIFGFTDIRPKQYSIRFPNYSDLKSNPFWYSQVWKSVIVNVPSTYPVKAMNGIHISGFVSIDREKSVYPPSLLPELDRLNYRIDVDSTIAHRSVELFISDLEQTLEARIRTYRHLWSLIDWKLFLLVFTGTDRLMHFLWNAYEDPRHSYHQTFLRHFRRIDEIVGEIKSQLDEEDFLILISDHGFEKLESDVYVNYVLRSEGFLQLQNGREADFAAIDFPTKAFALDPARIYINLKDKFPAGSVHPKDRERVLTDLEGVFSSLTINGQKIIRHLYRREDIYSGPYIDRAPDLVLVGNPGFNLKGLINPESLSGRSIFTGKHSLENAFVLYTDSTGVNYPGRDPTVESIGELMKTVLRN